MLWLLLPSVLTWMWTGRTMREIQPSSQLPRQVRTIWQPSIQSWHIYIYIAIIKFLNIQSKWSVKTLKHYYNWTVECPTKIMYSTVDCIYIIHLNNCRSHHNLKLPSQLLSRAWHREEELPRFHRSDESCYPGSSGMCQSPDAGRYSSLRSLCKRTARKHCNIK